MQLNLSLLWGRRPAREPQPDVLRVGTRAVPLQLVPNPRARRYILRLRPDGSARVTIPRRGSAAEGRRFAERNLSWLEGQLARQAARPNGSQAWSLGTELLLRGEKVRLEAVTGPEPGWVRIGPESFRVKDPTGDLRPAVERHLRQLATRELPARVLELAALHQAPVRRVAVRNQRSRWGSCSRRGTVSLNWRLVQAPSTVRDYLILHELAHLREMNHSRRFWREVEKMCPEFTQAESWLKEHSGLLK
jgi:predicted metal-dependent hydrolase